MIKVTSTFANTQVVPANSHGPYVVDGGFPITLSAGAPVANASYFWDLGDGSTATTSSVVHTYGDDGIYVAKLTVTVNEPGGAVSRHFAIIQARNVAPTVNAGPNRTVNEGDIIDFTGTFSDPEWLESHSAFWDWGDSSPSDVGAVAETHNPPAAQGTVTGAHAWGDSGTYPVTLTVQDEGGAIGRGRLIATVLNVPPTVDAGSPMFAYPCSVFTFQGQFVDPGWLDFHAGFVDFGDCSGSHRAVVRETNKPPAAKGVVISSHVYHECGTYQLTCSVIDDDGGVGKAATTISVVDVLNAAFEQGFRQRQMGAVANHWEPYLAKVPAPGGAPDFSPMSISGSSANDIFSPEEFRVHHGERSQRIHFVGKSRAGILQLVGANPGWDYQISAWYSLNEQAGGVSELLKDIDDPSDMVPPDSVGGAARLGIDPQGGTDPSADSVVWSEGYLRQEWAQLTVRAVADSNAITIFLEGEGSGRLGVDVCFDDVSLAAVQPFCSEKEPEPPGEKEVCTTFSEIRAGTRVPPIYVQDGFRFASQDGQPQRIVASGVPLGENKLEVRPRGLLIDLPFASDVVRLVISNELSVPLTVHSFDSKGQITGSIHEQRLGAVEDVEITGQEMARIQVAGKEGVLLIKICAHPDPTGPGKPLPGPPEVWSGDKA